MIPSNLTNQELIRLNEYRDDLTELEHELLTRLESTDINALDFEEANEKRDVELSPLHDRLENLDYLLTNISDGLWTCSDEEGLISDMEHDPIEAIDSVAAEVRILAELIA